MDVTDSIKHLVSGEMKDTQFLAKEIMLVMMKIDPQRELFDMVAFDCAANVQKAGKIIESRCPKTEG